VATRRLSTSSRYIPPSTGIDIPGTWVVQRGEDIQRLVNFLENTKEVVTTDTETVGCDPRVEHPRYKARATSVQFSTKEIPRIYLDNYRECEGNIRHLKKWAENPDRLKDGHNLKYDMMVFANHGARLQGVDCDTIVVDYLLDTSADGEHDLETAVFRAGITPQVLPGYRETFSYFPMRKDGVTPMKKPALRHHTEWWDMGEKAKVINYACKDAYYNRLLREKHEKSMRAIPYGKTRNYWDYYRLVDLPMLDVLFEMERDGVVIDSDHMRGLSSEFAEEIEAADREFLQALLQLGVPQDFLETFNPGSSDQLGNVLYDMLGYNCPKWTGKRPGEGSRSVDKPTLELLISKQKCTFLESLLRSREFGKLHSTYTEALPAFAAEYKGNVHTSLNQIGTATMRLSSSRPNLQNIPTRTKLGKRIREGFIAPPGCEVLVADYSQIELRVTAHKSKDPTLLRYFHEGKDPHALSAYHLFPHVRKAIDELGMDIDTKEAQKYVKTHYKEERDRGKTWNFMVIYGGGEQRAMDVFKVSKKEAVEKMAIFFDTYPGVQGMIHGAHTRAHRDGFVTTMFGRRCHIPHIHSQIFWMAKQGERQAANYEVQGSAQDIIKMGMISLHRNQRLRQLGYRQALQIHDEVLGYNQIGTGDEVQPIVEHVMATAYKDFGFPAMIVETPVEAGRGSNWAVAKV
jgi:DNA polymerase-1